jgi:phage terminase large subunit GpA-like protein
VNVRERITAMLADVWLPPERLSVSDWAEKYRVLTGKQSARQGLWSNQTTPYLTGVMDAACDPRVKTITMCKSSQSGGTEALFNIMLWSHEQRPRPCLLVYPTKELAADICKTRIREAVRNLPSIQANQDQLKDLDTSQTIMHLPLPRANVWLVGSNSESALKSRPIGLAIVDELDECAEHTESMVEARMRTFPNALSVYASTPTGEHRGIYARYLRSDQRRYFVPCPFCKHAQPLIFSRLRWAGGAGSTPEQIKPSVAYCCEQCEAQIPPGRKEWMVARGAWAAKGMKASYDSAADCVIVAGQPDRTPEHAGFLWSQLYSPFVPWSQVAIEFCQQRGQPSADWLNQTLAEPQRASAQRLEFDTIARHIPKASDTTHRLGVVPKHCMCLTAGIDMQRSSAFVIVRGWAARGSASWLIDRLRVDFDGASEADAARKLREVLAVSYPFATDHPLRTLNVHGMPLWGACIDSGDGPRAGSIYTIVTMLNRSLNSDLCIACKGQGDMGVAPIRLSSSAMPSGEQVPLLHINVRMAKDTLASAIGRTPLYDIGTIPPQLADPMQPVLYFWPPPPEASEDATARFTGSLTEYCQSMTSEHLSILKHGKSTITRWVPRYEGAANHYWDAEVYAAAAAEWRAVRFADVHWRAEK